MKNRQKGSILLIVAGVITVLVIGGFYTYNHVVNKPLLVVQPQVQITANTQSTTTTNLSTKPNVVTPIVQHKLKATTSIVSTKTNQPLVVKVISPNGGETIKMNETIQVRWIANKVLSPKNIFLITTSGGSLTVNASATTTTYSYPLTIKSTGVSSDIFYDVEPGAYKMNISLYDGVAPTDKDGKTCSEKLNLSCSPADTFGKLIVEDESDNTFTIS